MKSLKELLGDDLFTQVEAKLKEDTTCQILVDSKDKPNYIPKDRFDQVNNEKKDMKKQNETLLNNMDELKGKLKDQTELTTQIDKYKKENAESLEKIKDAKIDAELKIALIKNKAKNPGLVEKLIDRKTLTLDDNGVQGLQEQLDTIKQSDAYLFDAVDPTKPTEPPKEPPTESKPEPGTNPSNPQPNPNPSEPPKGGTGSIGSGSSNNNPPVYTSIGARLAAKRVEANKNTNSQGYFKIEK